MCAPPRAPPALSIASECWQSTCERTYMLATCLLDRARPHARPHQRPLNVTRLQAAGTDTPGSGGSGCGSRAGGGARPARRAPDQARRTPRGARESARAPSRTSRTARPPHSSRIRCTGRACCRRPAPRSAQRRTAAAARLPLQPACSHLVAPRRCPLHRSAHSPGVRCWEQHQRRSQPDQASLARSTRLPCRCNSARTHHMHLHHYQCSGACAARRLPGRKPRQLRPQHCRCAQRARHRRVVSPARLETH